MIFQNSCAPAFRITWLSPLGSIEDFPKTAKVRCEGPHPLCDALSRRGLTPIKLAYDWRRPAALTASAFNWLYGHWRVCQQYWSHGLQLCMNDAVSSLAVATATASTHSCLPTEGWLRVSWPVCVVLCRGDLPDPKTVTHPGTNRAWCRVTMLIESKALPLRHTR